MTPDPITDSNGVNGQIPPDSSIHAPHATAGRCAQASTGLPEDQQPATNHEEPEREMDADGKVGECPEDHFDG